MSLTPPQPRSSPTGFPRVSGDEPIRPMMIRDLLPFSPRERG